MASSKTWFFLAFFITSSVMTFAQTPIVPLVESGIITNEPSIAIDPKYPAFQVLGSNTSNFMVSNNGGATWEKKIVDPKEGFYGDPVVYITQEGDVYLCHLSKTPKKKHPEMFDRIVFEKSSQMGDSFKSIGVGYNAGKMQDKPWMAVDENKKSKYKGRIYLSWTEFDAYESSNPADSSRIRFAYSDGGDSFSKAITVSDTSGDAIDDDKTAEGATIAVGKDGTLYMFWARNGKIYMDQSTDGGITWGKDKVIATQKGGWNHNGITGLHRANSMPFSLIDNSGMLYVAFADNRNGDLDVFVTTSKDKGITWLPPVRVNNDALKNGKDQYMPHITVDRKTGEVYCAYYDRRNSENNRYVDVYLTSLSKGKPKKHVRVTNASFCTPGTDERFFFGDYISVAASKGAISLAFMEYDHSNLIVTVKVALMNKKFVSSAKSSVKEPFIKALYLADSGQVMLHFEKPGARSATLEITRAGRSVYKQLFEQWEGGPVEVMIPVKRIGMGQFDIKLSEGSSVLEEKIYIHR